MGVFAAGCAHSGYTHAEAHRPAVASAPRSTMSAEEIDLHERYGRTPALRVQFGKATYYGESLAGNLTASGEVFDPWRFTAAHRELPFGTVIRVVRLDTGKHTYVEVNDRGPFGDGRRVVDLAKIAAARLDMIRAGVVDVRIEILEWGDGKYRRARVARR